MLSGRLSIFETPANKKMSYIKLFESKKIRSEWNESDQKWYFAIIDAIEVLTESNNARRYWSDLKRKLNTEGISQLYEIIVQLKIIFLYRTGLNEVTWNERSNIC